MCKFFERLHDFKTREILYNDPAERDKFIVLAAVTNTNVLTWNERLHIAVDAAHGLQTNQIHDYSYSMFLDSTFF